MQMLWYSLYQSTKLKFVGYIYVISGGRTLCNCVSRESVLRMYMYLISMIVNYLTFPSKSLQGDGHM